jgi:hypothetical protein
MMTETFKPIDLSNMTGADLERLQEAIISLREAGDELKRGYAEPLRYAMSPGGTCAIYLTPLFAATLPDKTCSRTDFYVAEGKATAAATREQWFKAREREYFSARRGAPHDEVTEPQAAEEFDPTGKPLEPMQAEASSKPGRADAWTELELSQVFEAGVETLLAGRALTSAAQPLADALGRTVAACQKQLKVARERIEERAAELTPRPADPEPFADPVSPPAAARVQHNLPTDDLQAHLNTHAATGGWTAADDLRLFDLSETGWPMHEVALEIGKSSDEVKRRFELLTDKKGRKFARADVLDRLRLMQPVEA